MNQSAQIIDGHKVTCTQGVYMSDQGTGFSLEPWGEDTIVIKGFSTPCRFSLKPEYHIGRSLEGRRYIYPNEGGDYGMDLNDAIAAKIARPI